MITVYYYNGSCIRIIIMLIISNMIPLNSNDIFRQISLMISNQESSQQPLHYCTVYLWIELSQGRNQLLQIRIKCIMLRNYDDAHQVCRRHRFNELAVQIVENKIIVGKKKYERRMRESLHDRSKESKIFMKSSIHSKYRYSNKMKDNLHRNAYLQRQGERIMRSLLNSKSWSNNIHLSIILRAMLESELRISSKEIILLLGRSTKRHKKKNKVRNHHKNRHGDFHTKSLITTRNSPQQIKKSSKDVTLALATNYTLVQSQNSRCLRTNTRNARTQLPRQTQSVRKQSLFLNHLIIQKEYEEEPEKQKEKDNKRLALNTQKFIEKLNLIKESFFKLQDKSVKSHFYNRSGLSSQNRYAYKNELDHFTTLCKQARSRRKDQMRRQKTGKQGHFSPKSILEVARQQQKHFNKN